MNVTVAWKVILIWFAAVMVLFCIAREWSVAAFGITYGLGFGGIAYKYRRKVQPLFEKCNLFNYYGFLLLTAIITVTEEVYCYILGNQIAHPVLWADLVLVYSMWSVWFGCWYFFIARHYFFEEKEALMTAGFTGVFYEFVGTGAILENVFGIVIAVPLAVVVYAALFVWPLQLIPFTGKRTGNTKYVIGVVLPFLLTIPVALVLYGVLSGIGIL
jgi:hypothetical protein